MNDKELEAAIQQLKSSHTDNQSIEVKESVGKMPSTIAETISAFANGSGGTIILGLSEENDLSRRRVLTPDALPMLSRRHAPTNLPRPFAPISTS